MTLDRSVLNEPEVEQLRAVLHRLAPEKRFVLAFSGGLDSRFLAFASLRLGFEPTLVHIEGPQVSPLEARSAGESARALGFSMESVSVSFDFAALAAAGRARCLVCKRRLFGALLDAVRSHDWPGPVCDGTNASDRLVFRPGMQALRELGIRSPLLEAGVTKARIREMGRAWGLPDPDQPARPCLLTRFPYGAAPSEEALSTAAAAEGFVEKDAFGSGLRFRIRFPSSDGAVLHVERGSVERLAADRLNFEMEALCGRLRRTFGEKLPNLRWEVLDRLSGWFDRASAGGA